jgi:hypothetical protein
MSAKESRELLHKIGYGHLGLKIKTIGDTNIIRSRKYRLLKYKNGSDYANHSPIVTGIVVGSSQPDDPRCNRDVVTDAIFVKCFDVQRCIAIEHTL